MSFSRLLLLAALTALAVPSVPARAQGLRTAVDAAWTRSAAGRSQPARTDEAAAKREAARAWFPEAPSLSLMHRNDALTGNRGGREYEAGVSVPVPWPATRSSGANVADAEASRTDARGIELKWRLAGEVREAYWQWRASVAERRLAERKVTDARRLADDVDRRVRQGEVRSLDLAQARAVEAQARVALAEADSRLFRARRAFELLTGMAPPADATETERPDAPAMDAHPRIRALKVAVDVGNARVRQARSSGWGAPEVGLGMRRERESRDERRDTSLLFQLRVPFPNTARERAQTATAGADLVEAEAELALERERLAAEIAASREELAQARAAVAHAQARRRLSVEAHTLTVRAYAAGEVDLATRLRIEAERFEAELGADRAAIDAARAIARLNQARGVLP
jgi:cobalt-zinc-cadmium efflux system outer membrane protein